jgi:hypothetical protein
MNESAPQAVMQAAETGDITMDMLKETFDHWRIFKCAGWFWAMRSGETVVVDGPRSLIRPVLIAVTVLGLAEQLSIHEWLRRMTAAELDAVWHDGIAAAAEAERTHAPTEKTS